ncbi:hypothetical protein ASPFODRAFT_52373, partial [Aspergillus luchuensis CBS 106.47]
MFTGNGALMTCEHANPNLKNNPTDSSAPFFSVDTDPLYHFTCSRMEGAPQKRNTKHGIPATPKTIVKELRRLYWVAVRDEVQNMIRFYCEMKKAAYQPHVPPRLECDNFEKMFNIWVGSQPNFDKAAGSSLYHETLQRAQEHLNEPESNDHRYARLILQSSS